MAAPPATVSSVPATLDDTTLSRALPSRPDWQRLTTSLNGLNGYELFELEEHGAAVMTEVAQKQVQIRQYKEKFIQWYWKDNNPFGMVERAAEVFAEARLAEIERAENAEQQCKAISGQFLAAKKNAVDARIRAQEAEERRKKEEERKAQLAALEAEKAAADATKGAEIQAEMEQVASAPITTTHISRAQASAGLTATPKGLSGTTVYLRRVTDPKKFWAWMGQHPEEAATLKLVPNFTKYKNNREKIIPGVCIEEKTESTNRGR